MFTDNITNMFGSRDNKKGGGARDNNNNKKKQTLYMWKLHYMSVYISHVHHVNFKCLSCREPLWHIQGHHWISARNKDTPFLQLECENARAHKHL